jgi:hypothetical protein
MSDPISRRDFLHVTAAAGAIGSLGFTPGGEQARAVRPATGQADAGWFDRPMRWVQLTLVENDPGRFDPQFWLDYFRRLHADAATLSAGGIVAYYPTEVPLHHRSTSLGAGDPFGELVAGCRAMKMNVLARVDPHAVRDRGSRRASGLDLGDGGGGAAPSLGQPGSVGDLRARSVQLRVHGPRQP